MLPLQLHEVGSVYPDHLSWLQPPLYVYVHSPNTLTEQMLMLSVVVVLHCDEWQ